MQQINKERLKQEIGAGFKPLALDVGLSALPYDELGDRDFENLIYCLVNSEITLGEYGAFDNVMLMQGVGERGRDCVLYTSQKVSGTIQCKKMKARLSRPALIKELVKFLLFTILDKDLMPGDTCFEYHCYASGGFSEPALKLASSFTSEIELEISDGRLAEYLKQVSDDFESFSDFRNTPPFDLINQALRKIVFKTFDGTSINARLAQKSSVLSSFFQVHLVVEHEAVKSYFRQEFESAGLNFLTDENLKSLHSRLMSTTKDSRVALGSVDLYGYNMEFLKYLKNDGFSELIKKTTDLRTFLDAGLTKYLADKIGRMVYSEITVPFVFEEVVLPFTTSVVMQYLLRLALPKISEGAIPEKAFLKMYPTAKNSPEEVLKIVAEDSLLSQRMVTRGDYSRFPDPDPDREKRLWLFESLRAGCSVEDLEARFWKDMEKIRRVVSSISSEIAEEFSGTRTVIIKDSAFLSDPVEMKRVIENMKILNEIPGSESSTAKS
ncbi:hypothetical protein JFT81_16280 [Pseudomonas sp. TH43]|uniref:hypothetical protein n=1 Tax=Pseudomonas sp. TH43 TaxID=2796407 RepID=UPI0019123C13|nr:hypothetical protein [Pseudomonas sp. TH43]MBK5376189.1 hypothetical protein [Pseudomonas sp. TH43]